MLRSEWTVRHCIRGEHAGRRTDYLRARSGPDFSPKQTSHKGFSDRASHRRTPPEASAGSWKPSSWLCYANKG